MRKRSIEKGNQADVTRYSRKIYIAFVSGLPFGIAALTLGIMK
ncbi:MAG: hypothetical protein OEV66_05460 [Spirochaetia bacterium]|nr:hypothetical protein [Spirochaetia bacterium]